MNIPKLTIELVPSTCWASNVRTLVTASEWNKCKKIVRERSGDQCEICGGRGRKWPVECHEIWRYQWKDGQYWQILDGLIALCPECHLVKHFGRATVAGQKREAFRHLLKVNGWTFEDGQAYVDTEFELWAIRSEHEWKLDLSYLDRIDIKLRDVHETTR
jgi:hypothetical protein